MDTATATGTATAKTTSRTARQATGSGVGDLVRHWRVLRRMSQMDLALAVGISPRHLSFVENGRARPGPEVLLALAEQLDLPLRSRNAWLMAAGHAPRFTEQALDSQRMVAVKAALRRLLDAHDPFPGVVLDRHWNLVLFNRAVARLLDLLPPALREGPLNMMRVSLHPAGFAALTTNLSDWGSYLLGELQKLQQISDDPAVSALVAEIHSYPNVVALRRQTAGRRAQEAGEDAPILVPCEITLGGQALSLFTTLTTFGTPRDITLDELCVELFYPANPQTEAALRAMATT